MKKLCLITILAVLFTFSDCKEVEQSTYSGIEKGLVPAVMVEDSPVSLFSIQERMKHYNVPGASIALFKNGEIVWRKAYGVSEKISGNKVTAETRFQAASISKSVMGFGVLKLAENYHLNLDTDINAYLKSWKIHNSFQQLEDVTIRRLLTHTAGINVSGMMGYEKTDTLPKTTDILNGKGKTPPIKLDTVPGSKYSYSGGGICNSSAIDRRCVRKKFYKLF